MTAATPPAIATWLLTRLGSGPQRNALAGDLSEQYQQGRSRTWYWSQVLRAIAIGAIHDLGDHLLFVLRALALWYVLSLIAAWATASLHQFFGVSFWNWTVSHDFDTLRVIWFGGPRLGSPLMLTLACVNSIWIGWIVARLHRRHSAAAVLSCAAFIAFYVVFVRYTWVNLWPLTFFVNAPFVAPTPFFVGAVAFPLCFLVGGVFGSNPDDAGQHGVLTADN
jgi:hypothetical protein